MIFKGIFGHVHNLIVLCEIMLLLEVFAHHTTLHMKTLLDRCIRGVVAIEANLLLTLWPEINKTQAYASNKSIHVSEPALPSYNMSARHVTPPGSRDSASCGA